MLTVIVTVLLFLLMVSLHEFGHYIVARIFNFKILEYAIGFGPKLIKKEKNSILYTIRAIPLGGYCKFEGEDEASDDPRAFSNRPVWQRILVVAAGGVFNVILGFVVFALMMPSLSPVATNVVEDTVKYSYLEDAGVKKGDEIIEINGKKISFYNDIALYTDKLEKDDKMNITIKRDGEKLNFNIMPTEQTVIYNYLDSGVECVVLVNRNEEKEFIPYGDTLKKQDNLIGTSQKQTRYLIGVTVQNEDITFSNMWGYAFNNTRFVVRLVYSSLWDMITGKADMSQMSGPVGIVREVNNAVTQESYSLLHVLNLLALLTINLGVFNLLPFPALDGGRMFFMIVELIRRKPIPPEKEGTVHAIGMLLLLALVVFVSFNDIIKLIK